GGSPLPSPIKRKESNLETIRERRFGHRKPLKTRGFQPFSDSFLSATILGGGHERRTGRGRWSAVAVAPQVPDLRRHAPHRGDRHRHRPGPDDHVLRGLAQGFRHPSGTLENRPRRLPELAQRRVTPTLDLDGGPAGPAPAAPPTAAQAGLPSPGGNRLR